MSVITDEAFRALLGDREKLLELVAALREHGLRLTEAGTVELIPAAQKACPYCGKFFGQHTNEQWRLCEVDALAHLRSRCSDNTPGQDVAP